MKWSEYQNLARNTAPPTNTIVLIYPKDPGHDGKFSLEVDANGLEKNNLIWVLDKQFVSLQTSKVPSASDNISGWSLMFSVTRVFVIWLQEFYITQQQRLQFNSFFSDTRVEDL
jgi:hypothetical protein